MVAAMPSAISATPAQWRAGVGRLGVDDAREGLGDAIQARVVGAQDPVGGLDGLHVGRSSEAQKHTSRSSSSTASTSAGSNQVPRRARATSQAAAAPPCCQKTSIVCDRQAMRASSEISSPACSPGWPCRPSARRAG
jgi:hypothetical protein